MCPLATPPLFTVALFEPQIPPNTGNISRLCGACECRLDVVGKIGFEINDKQVRRAGLDYWEYVDFHREENLEAYLASKDPNTIHLLTTKASKTYFEAEFKEGDTLIFGSETKGIDEAILEKHPERCITIPMASPHIRSLNLSNSASIVLYEALRQTVYSQTDHKQTKETK